MYFAANKWRQKLHKTSGETLTETLCALLLMVLAFTMLSAAVLSGARANAMMKQEKVYSSKADAVVTAGTVTLDGSVLDDVTVYEDGQFWFFE